MSDVITYVELSTEGHYEPNNPSRGCLGSAWFDAGKVYVYFDKIVKEVYCEKFNEIDQERRLWFHPFTIQGDDIPYIVYRLSQMVVHDLIHLFGEEHNEELVKDLTKLVTGDLPGDAEEKGGTSHVYRAERLDREGA